MPRTSFSAGMLGGAVPGLSKLAAALSGGGQAEQAGFDAQNMQQSKMAQMLAQMEASKASAALHNAQAGEVQSKQRVLDGRPGLYEEQVAASSGTSLPLVQAIRNGLKTGSAPQLEMAGPTEDGGPLMGNIPADQQSNVMRAMREFLPLLSNSGDLKPDDLAQAAGLFQNQRQEADAAAGLMPVEQLSKLRYAAKGSAPYHFDSTGFVGNQLTGALDTSNPGAQSTIGLRGAQAGQAKAAAANQYAGADAHRASAAKTIAETGQITNGGGIGKAPAGYRWAADGKTLEAIPGGPAAKEANISEGERKAGSLLMRLRGSQQQMLTAVGQTPSAEKPLAAAEFVRMIPWVGGDTPANVLTPEARQQVEAAQLDMLDAALTLGTGAAYTKEQLRGYAKSYFPQIGDKPQALQDKRVRLANVIRAAEVAAGRAAATAMPAPQESSPPVSPPGSRPPLASFNR